MQTFGTVLSALKASFSINFYMRMSLPLMIRKKSNFEKKGFYCNLRRLGGGGGGLGWP